MVNTPMPNKTRTLMATLVIFLSVLLFSGQPIIVAWGDGNSNPFLFNSAWRTGLVFGGLAFLLAFYRPILLNIAVIHHILASAFLFRGGPNAPPDDPGNGGAKRLAMQLVRWAIPITVIGNFDFAIFSLPRTDTSTYRSQPSCSKSGPAS